MTTHDCLFAMRLHPTYHKMTCGYWYTVTSRGMPHTAFATREGLDKWMKERGLKLAGALEEVPSSSAIQGSYRTDSSMDIDQFESIPGDRSMTYSNGDIVEAILEKDPDGVVTVHTLNPNVKGRKVFDYATASKDIL